MGVLYNIEGITETKILLENYLASHVAGGFLFYEGSFSMIVVKILKPILT
jgi:hypothetical protein